MNAELQRRIDLAIAVVQDARAYEHEHGLTSRHTRQLPRGILRQLAHWRKVTATSEHRATLCESQPIAPATGSEADASELSVREEPVVATSPIVGVRIPEPLKRQAEVFAREHRWSFGETTRVALERLVGYDAQEPEGDTHPRTAA